MSQNLPRVSIIMGSKSDWSVMEHAAKTLEEFGIGHEVRVLSAHRSPEAAASYVSGLAERGVKVLIAAAGMAAHLAGASAAHTALPVLGVPLSSPALQGLDALLSTVQMPAGVPVATFAIGKAGAINAAVFAAQILSLSDPDVKRQVEAFRTAQTEKVLAIGDPREG